MLDFEIERTDNMSHFVSLIRYTQQGIAKIKESPARLDAAKKAAEKAGGKIHGWYLTMGQYDAVIISEFPNDEACAKFSLSVGALGNVTTETLKAFSEAEYRKIVGGLS
ncbi:MAG TPA: GYD domain-containing protein [Terriglobales bacterium]|nr:GYD domain-containing protein [Terriglobales bacterium]